MIDRAARSPLPWLGGLLALYLVVPIVGLLVRLTQSHGQGFTAPGLWAALAISVATATISAALIGVFGIPLAYFLARHEGRLSTIVGAAVQLPLALPPLMSGILLIYLIGPDTPLGRVFGGRLTDSMVGIVIAQTFVAAPFLIIAARSAFAAIDRPLMEVATTLGLDEVSRFFRVCLPLAAPGITAGLLLTWLRAFGEFGATVILAYHPFSLPVFTYVQFGSTGLPDTLAPTTLALVAAFAFVCLIRWRPRQRVKPVGDLPPPANPRRQMGRALRFSFDHHVGPFHLQVSHQLASLHLAILGPSGSGKTTILRSLAGLFGASAGRVWVDAVELSRVPAEERAIGYVPQEPSLFPNLGVWRQVLFGRGADPAVAAYWLAHLKLDGLAERLPGELSGGQRQRVALARALSREPQLVLLDEPFSSLDAPVRDELRRDLRRLQRRIGVTSVVVTHDPEEAALLADEVMVIDNGRILQVGFREEVLSHPASPEVARFVGIQNFHAGVVTRPGVIDVAGHEFEVTANEMAPGTPVLWSARQERVEIRPGARHLAHVVDRIDLPSSTELRVQLADGPILQVRTTRVEEIEPGMDCSLDIAPHDISVWERTVPSKLKDVER